MDHGDGVLPFLRGRQLVEGLARQALASSAFSSDAEPLRATCFALVSGLSVEELGLASALMGCLSRTDGRSLEEEQRILDGEKALRFASWEPPRLKLFFDERLSSVFAQEEATGRRLLEEMACFVVEKRVESLFARSAGAVRQPG